MFRSDRSFVKTLFTESGKDTTILLIKYCDIPQDLENILIDIYAEGLELKEIAYNISVDERTVKRYHARALELAEKSLMSKIKLSLLSH